MRALSCKNRVIKSVFVVIAALLCLISFCACNATEQEGSSAERRLYLLGFSYGEDGVVNAVVSISGGEELDCFATMLSDPKPQGAFYYSSRTTIVLHPDTIYSAVRGAMSQEDWSYNGIEYNRLKVVFRYDTIYKSVKSDGQIQVSGRYHLHSFPLDEGDSEFQVGLTRKSPNSAAWYGALAAGGVALAVALTVTFAVLIKRRKKDGTLVLQDDEDAEDEAKDGEDLSADDKESETVSVEGKEDEPTSSDGKEDKEKDIVADGGV